MHAHSHVTVLIHAVWATEDRRPVLKEGFDDSLAGLLTQKSAALGCRLVGAGIAPDHVHVLVRLASTATVAGLMQRLKGSSAHEANAHLANRLPLEVAEWILGRVARSGGRGPSVALSLQN